MAPLLIADEDEQFAALLQYLLIKQGYHVQTVSSLNTLCEYAAEHKPQLIIMEADWHSGMNMQQAFSFFQKLSIPLILSSADYTYELYAVQLKAFFLKKPYTAQQLFKAIQEKIALPVVSGQSVFNSFAYNLT
jgi:DNA-binding NtrC family response regulator